MIAIINVINNPSFIKRSLQSLHETEIFTFLFFLPQKETEISDQDKNDNAAPSWGNGYFLGHRVYTGMILA